MFTLGRLRDVGISAAQYSDLKDHLELWAICELPGGAGGRGRCNSDSIHHEIVGRYDDVEAAAVLYIGGAEHEELAAIEQTDGGNLRFVIEFLNFVGWAPNTLKDSIARATHWCTSKLDAMSAIAYETGGLTPNQARRWTDRGVQCFEFADLHKSTVERIGSRQTQRLLDITENSTPAAGLMCVISKCHVNFAADILIEEMDDETLRKAIAVADPELHSLNEVRRGVSSYEEARYYVTLLQDIAETAKSL